MKGSEQNLYVLDQHEVERLSDKELCELAKYYDSIIGELHAVLQELREAEIELDHVCKRSEKTLRTSLILSNREFAVVIP